MFSLWLYVTLKLASALQDTLGACMPQVSGVELDSMVSSIKDLLPELGEGFIEVCHLIYYTFMIHIWSLYNFCLTSCFVNYYTEAKCGQFLLMNISESYCMLLLLHMQPLEYFTQLENVGFFQYLVTYFLYEVVYTYILLHKNYLCLLPINVFYHSH